MTRPPLRFDAIDFRRELMSLPETSAWENLAPPKLTEIHVPPTHGKALSPDCSIVEGMRGAGKSFWTAVLANEKTRTYVYDTAKLPGMANVVVGVGFGLDLSNDSFPSRTRMESLLNSGFGPDAVWRAVLLRHALKALHRPLPFDDEWEEAVRWVEGRPTEADQCLADCDRALLEQDRVLLLLFDSLDRLADDWGRIRQILSAALKLCLECRTRRAIRLKFFLRPDMVEEDDEVWRFADSSKLLHSRAKLDWRPDELYGVILLHLANSANVGAEFREALWQRAQVQWQAIDNAYPLPKGLRESIRDVVEALAGPWVGRSATKGYTYTWIPTHLSDAKGRLSPRSILLAFKEAAEWTDRHQQEHSLPLHFQGVQQGVVKASEIRISEIKEDYPWVEPLLHALKGVTVPLAFADLREWWTNACAQESLDAATGKQRLPPRRYSSDTGRNLSVLMDDLVELAVFYQTQDKRFNMPDIFRVGFGIKRKGGVRPPR